MKISILLPTRGRTEVLKTSIMTLLDNVKEPSDIEIILGLDEDDNASIDYVKEHLGPILQEKGVETKANIFKPLGYNNLHQYVNTLGGNASGDWLFFWNDDCLMQTKHWDEVIDSYTGQFKLLAPKDNHNGHPYAILPIVPKDWFILMGHLSQNAHRIHVRYIRKNRC